MGADCHVNGVAPPSIPSCQRGNEVALLQSMLSKHLTKVPAFPNTFLGGKKLHRMLLDLLPQ
eukprot:2353158-Amphidinium_carterae.1